MKTWRFTALSFFLLMGIPSLGWPQNCTVSATMVNFGNYNPLSALNTNSTGTLTVSCTEYRLGIGGGTVMIPFTEALSTGNSGSYSNRYMTSGVQQLNYNLFSNATYTTIWGDGTGGSQNVSDTVTASCTGFFIQTCTGSQSDTAYGLMPAQQNVSAGIYNDSITATISF
jgi:spore coat protein U domain-containing protein, fimbrial subunit CupE1/2/3/6